MKIIISIRKFLLIWVKPSESVFNGDSNGYKWDNFERWNCRLSQSYALERLWRNFWIFCWHYNAHFCFMSQENLLVYHTSKSMFKKVCAFATSVLVKKFESPKITVAWIFRLQEAWHVLRKPSMIRSNLRVIEFLTVASHRISKMTCIFNWTIRAKMLIKNLKPDWMANQMSDILCSKIKFENFWNFY